LMFFCLTTENINFYNPGIDLVFDSCHIYNVNCFYYEPKFMVNLTILSCVNCNDHSLLFEIKLKSKEKRET